MLLKENLKKGKEELETRAGLRHFLRPRRKERLK